MSIDPIVQAVTVTAPPERAFSLFTASMGRWWKRGMSIGAKPHVEVVVEPRDGGRWFERDEDGAETDWGKVLAWEPPGRVLLGWQIDASFKVDPKLITEVEVTFVPEGTGTRVTLTHRNLERFGESAERVASQLAGGWPTLVQLYAEFTDREARDA
jgi:uncharacterized protein YndB with AHSA1/START domain